MALPHTSGSALIAGDERFQFDTARDAVEALRWLAAQEDVQEVFPCSWEIRLPASRLPEEIDFPGQMYGPCEGLCVGTSKGWHGLCGHGHVSGAEYFEEEEVLANVQAGHFPSADALLMDGRSVWAVL